VVDSDLKETFIARQLEAVRYYLAALVADAESRCLNELADHVTNYVDLLEDIESWRVRSGERERISLVTFNYDTLLERACRAVLGLKLSSLDDFTGEGNYIVLKLHGSIEWGEEVDRPGKALIGGDLERGNQLIDLVGRYQRTGRYAMAGQDLNGWGPLRPALSVPMVTKTGDDFACPAAHIRVLMDVIPYVSHLLVVGWRGVEGHFHEYWRRATAAKTVLQKGYIVTLGEESAEFTEATLRQQMAIGGGVLWDRHVSGFTSFADSSGVKKFLTS
jgi:hypothetical protein